MLGDKKGLYKCRTCGFKLDYVSATRHIKRHYFIGKVAIENLGADYEG